eukprot:scaffold260_cov115-Cylindrotheca_fusiformis.AAC.8
MHSPMSRNRPRYMKIAPDTMDYETVRIQRRSSGSHKGPITPKKKKLVLEKVRPESRMQRRSSGSHTRPLSPKRPETRMHRRSSGSHTRPLSPKRGAETKTHRRPSGSHIRPISPKRGRRPSDSHASPVSPRSPKQRRSSGTCPLSPKGTKIVLENFVATVYDAANPERRAQRRNSGAGRRSSSVPPELEKPKRRGSSCFDSSNQTVDTHEYYGYEVPEGGYDQPSQPRARRRRSMFGGVEQPTESQKPRRRASLFGNIGGQQRRNSGTHNARRRGSLFGNKKQKDEDLAAEVLAAFCEFED